MKSILFVCTGNICRSPMAEGLFRHAMRGNGEYRASSAGLGAIDGLPPSTHAVTAAQHLVLPHVSHAPSSASAAQKLGLPAPAPLGASASRPAELPASEPPSTTGTAASRRTEPASPPLALLESRR